MKDINNYIIERKGSNFKNFRYCISFSYKSGGWDKILTDDWKTEIRKEPLSSAEYWDVMDMHNNFASPESLVAWHGKGGYWANVYEDSMDPENSPKWRTVYTGKDLEKIKKCKQ